jgi:hypothetical protein
MGLFSFDTPEKQLDKLADDFIKVYRPFFLSQKVLSTSIYSPDVFEKYASDEEMIHLIAGLFSIFITKFFMTEDLRIKTLDKQVLILNEFFGEKMANIVYDKYVKFITQLTNDPETYWEFLGVGAPYLSMLSGDDAKAKEFNNHLSKILFKHINI